MQDDKMDVPLDTSSTQEFIRTVEADTRATSYFPDRRFEQRDVRSILRQLYYHIQVDLGISNERWEKMVAHYVAKNVTADKSATEIRSAIKKNFIRSGQMTLAMFCRALKILPIIRIRLGVTLVFANNKATNHGIWFKINEAEDLEGLDATIGDVQAPVRYITELNAKPGAHASITPQEGDHEILSQLADIAKKSDD